MKPPIKKNLETLNTEIISMMQWVPNPAGAKYAAKLQVMSTFSNEQEAEEAMKNFAELFENYINLKYNKNLDNKMLSENNNVDNVSTETSLAILVKQGTIVVDGTTYEPQIVDGIVLGSANDELKDYRTFEETYLPLVHRNHIEITQEDVPQARITIQEDGNPFTIVTESMDLNSLPPELRPAIAPRDSRYGNVLPQDIEKDELNPNTVQEYFEGRPLNVPKYSHGLKFNEDKKRLVDSKFEDVTLTPEEIWKLLDN